MIYRVSFTLNQVRKTGIRNEFGEYRPDWVSDNKPDYNGARVLIEGGKCELGETVSATLQPLIPALWTAVKVGDVLKAMEGPKQVGEAVVLGIEGNE